jgi:hypothetical protein
MTYPKTFGWNAVKLSEHSYADITILRMMVQTDPKSANPSGSSIYLYTPAAQRKLDALAWAVFYKQQEASKAGEA